MLTRHYYFKRHVELNTSQMKGDEHGSSIRLTADVKLVFIQLCYHLHRPGQCHQSGYAMK